ncbi:MAG TPA: hypothetical protein VGZ03_09830, partial [Acidimicrobiales bacterium]|nr:hypothetical protein [Acidimicrobiales bacterium]
MDSVIKRSLDRIQPRHAMDRKVTATFIAIAMAAVFLSANTILAATSRSSSPRTWSGAEEIHGLAPLNPDGFTGVNSISCATAGNCSAVGSYPTSGNPSQPRNQGFVLDESNGIWGNAHKVPGLSSLSSGLNAEIWWISCAAVGDCAAGGFYTDASRAEQGFVVDETAGVWGSAHAVPGLGVLNVGGSAIVRSISCGAVGDCAAVGTYTDSHGTSQGFVVDESGGTWGTAEAVPGLSALSAGRGTEVQAVSCAAAGSCAAGGTYDNAAGVPQGFVVDESEGTWDTAQAIPVATFKTNASSFAVSISCGAVGDCVAGGNYTDSHSVSQVFHMDQSNGTWGKVQVVHGLGALDVGNNETNVTVSCAAAGACALAGQADVPFVVDESGGSWGKATTLPGLGALSPGRYATMQSVSCGAAGSCAAVGYYDEGRGGTQGFVVDQSGGIWGRAQAIRPLGPPKLGGVAIVGLVSCAPGGCAAAGYYDTVGGTATTGFVTSEPSTPPFYCSPSAGLTATVASHQQSDGSVYYRIVYTNRSAFGCELAGIPGALGYSTKRHVPVGPPAGRSLVL